MHSHLFRICALAITLFISACDIVEVEPILTGRYLLTSVAAEDEDDDCFIDHLGGALWLYDGDELRLEVRLQETCTTPAGSTKSIRDLVSLGEYDVNGDDIIYHFDSWAERSTGEWSTNWVTLRVENPFGPGTINMLFELW